MGAGQSAAIQVNFNRPSSCFCVGEQVLGTVCFTNVRDNMKVDEMFIEFVGELGYTTRETRSTTDSNGNSSSESYTAYHHIPFSTLRMPLTQPKDETYNNMAIGRGTYTWPFEFHISHDLPPSSSPNPTAYPYIKYYVRMVVDRPWYKPNMWKTCPLTIFPQPTISQQINELQQPLFFGERNRKQLRLEGYLYTRSIVPGQSLSFQFTLYNPERTTIKKIKASFVQCRQTNHDSRQDVIISTDLPGLNEFNDTSLQRNFELPVPSDYLTPTHTFTTLHQNCSYSFALLYELKLEIRPHGAFTKFEIKLPVIVQTRPMDMDPIYMTNNSPPSYKEAMNN